MAYINANQFSQPDPIQHLKDELMDPDLESLEFLFVPENPNFAKIWYMLDDWDA
jgi:hypothetical protein